MGIYLNPGSGKFEEALNSEIYVDKSGLIAYTNKVFGTKQKYVCVSRPRRFGKSIIQLSWRCFLDSTMITGIRRKPMMRCVIEKA